MKRALFLSALVPLFVACGGSADDAALFESGESELRGACTARFTDATTVRNGVDNKIEAQRMASAYFSMALGIESGETASFVYKDAGAMAELRKRADALKAALGSKAASLSPVIDALVAEAATYNLKGKTDAEIASSFRCLSAASKAVAIKDVNAVEKPLDLTTTQAKPLLDRIMVDVNDESNTWGDTILEGPYATTENGHVSIYASDELRLAGKRIALRVTFGEKAVMTDSDGCDQAADESWPAACQQGTIQQTLYFATDLSRIQIEDEYADFYEK